MLVHFSVVFCQPLLAFVIFHLAIILFVRDLRFCITLLVSWSIPDHLYKKYHMLEHVTEILILLSILCSFSPLKFKLVYQIYLFLKLTVL